MAVRTNYELIDILDAEKDYSITATDLEDTTQTVITSANAMQYMSRKYATRFYSVLRGGSPATVTDATNDFASDFRLWLTNRQHNIDKLYQSMFDYDYSPIENVDRHESETIDATDATTYGRKDTESGSDSVTYGKKDTESGTDSVTYGKKDTQSGTDSTTYGKKDTQSGTDSVTYGKKDTESGTDTLTKGGSEVHEIDKAGFNSPSTYSNDTKDTLSFTNRTEGTQYGHVNTESGTDSTQYGHTNTQSGTDSTQYGHTNTQSGTDSTQYGHTNTQSGTDSTQYGHVNTQSGTDSTDHDSERTLHVHGNIGVTSNVQLLTEEETYRLQSLAELLIDNFINDYTYYS